jgi:hypothetical protein
MKEREMKTEQEYSDMADLHYAHQFGQDYVRQGYNKNIITEFDKTFKGGHIYKQEFDRGVKYEETKFN